MPPRLRTGRLAVWTGVAAILSSFSACSTRTMDGATPPSACQFSTSDDTVVNRNLDLLFVIDDSPSMTAIQPKLKGQLATFLSAIQSSDDPLDLHVAVISSDMGAPGDSPQALGCTTSGDGGGFHFAPGQMCNATLSSGSTFIVAADGQQDVTGSIDDLFSCISSLGAGGCGVSQPLAAVDRALGADGSPSPPQNANFLRPDAYLGIVFVTNQDDCSAPAGTSLFSLAGAPDGLANPLGPLTPYRCNRFGHLCQDPNAAAPTSYAAPPLMPPADASGAQPAVAQNNCESNNDPSSFLVPTTKFVNDIRALKPDPDNTILVSAIIGPPEPYGVEWTTPPDGTAPAGEAWPRVQHSCGPAGADDVNPAVAQSSTDGSFADPAVRLTEFVNAFPNSVLASICDPSYQQALLLEASSLESLIEPPCIPDHVAQDAAGNPLCTVTQTTIINGDGTFATVPACTENGNVAPCWTVVTDGAGCPGSAVTVSETPAQLGADSVQTRVDCQLSTTTDGGCPQSIWAL